MKNIIGNETTHSFNDQIIKDFLVEKKLVCGASEKTINKYRNILERFLELCQKRADNIQSEDVLNWLETYHKKNKPSSVNTLLSSLSSFFDYILNEGIIEKSPIKNSWRQKIPKAIPKAIKNDEMARVLIYSEINLSLRDRTIIELLRSSGIRRCEVCNINFGDIDFNNNELRVFGKGEKERTVHFSEEAHQLLKQLVSNHISKDEPVFKNKFGNRLSRYSIWVITTKVGKAIGYPKYLNPHRFRHTFGTNLASNGASIEFIAEEMGHEDLYTTQIYINIPSKEAKLMYTKFMG